MASPHLAREAQPVARAPLAAWLSAPSAQPCDWLRHQHHQTPAAVGRSAPSRELASTVTRLSPKPFFGDAQMKSSGGQCN
eukprot:CAMPEP_0178445836 /NCGR_PEP_ID=MMETSP0689_2-20121128/40418_1 /TAXON_ID=160604 /ORGANISM="Amphidinium massartii, Strain CS-259" /LENGTH=79 /DNA_ID=CAMNT_0020070491 /DNA_START=167 /DNA_END=406 /DNA_ORIENTATION=+